MFIGFNVQSKTHLRFGLSCLQLAQNRNKNKKKDLVNVPNQHYYSKISYLDCELTK